MFHYDFSGNDIRFEIRKGSPSHGWLEVCMVKMTMQLQVLHRIDGLF